MGIKRGLIRVWIVISFLWAVVFLVIDGPGAVSNIKTIAAPEKVDAYPRLQSTKEGLDKWERKLARRELRDFGLGLVVFPALFWALLYAGFWITRGFKGKQ